jgi:hypothetical protein
MAGLHFSADHLINRCRGILSEIEIFRQLPTLFQLLEEEPE